MYIDHGVFDLPQRFYASWLPWWRWRVKKAYVVGCYFFWINMLGERISIVELLIGAFSTEGLFLRQYIRIKWINYVLVP